jgi:hypothetical protein
MGRETRTPTRMAWTAVRAASSGCFSPIRRATSAVVDIDIPMATANTTVRNDSVSPTAATASAPRRPTKNTSRIPKTDSISISRIMGTDSRKTAWPRLPSV